MDNFANGVHEIQQDVSSSEAGGSLSSVYSCKKNKDVPGYHDKFIPVKEFGVHHLPILPSDLNGVLGREEIVELVKACSPLVVRINVGFISNARPDKRQDQCPYPFADFKGRRLNNVGSGYIKYVDGPYSCRSLLGCGEGSKNEMYEDTCWRVVILTARHLVFDSTEARETKVDCFDEDLVIEKEGVLTLVGGKVRDADTERDHCWLICFTHDHVLAERLNNLCKNRTKMYDHLYKMVEDCDDVIGLPVIAISHPHGKTKYVSVGELSEESKSKKIAVYTTPTCPGSSGGVILEISGRYWDDMSQQQGKGCWGWFRSHPHSGASKKGSYFVGYSADWLWVF